MRKRVIVFFLMLSMVLSICSCGNNEENKEQNVEEISGYDTVESLEERVAITEELALEIENSIQNDPLTQLEYNEKTKELYEMWDSDLNAIWSELKVLLDEETFDTLLSEQREWITWKEEELKKAGADYEGGSMQPMVMNMKAAELTKTRVYELLEYLK